MFFSSWLRKPKAVSMHNRRGRSRVRPSIEPLEDRFAPATLVQTLYPPARRRHSDGRTFRR
jgi:hypothetical protein